MAASIREKQTVALKRMLNFNVPLVKSTDGEPVWKVLIYDRFGQDIISPLLSVKELRDMGVTLHLLLHSDRDAIPDVPAIYFVMPTEENVDRICQGLYPSSGVQGVMPQRWSQWPDITDTEMETIMDTIVDSLFCFFVTLGAVPIIRCPRGNAAEMVAVVQQLLQAVLVTNKKPSQVYITKVKQFEGSSSFVRRSQWTLDQLRQVNGIDPTRESPEFDLHFDNVADQWKPEFINCQSRLFSGNSILHSAADSVTSAVQKASQALNERGERLGRTEESTAEMMNSAQQFADTAHKLAMKHKC